MGTVDRRRPRGTTPKCHVEKSKESVQSAAPWLLPLGVTSFLVVALVTAVSVYILSSGTGIRHHNAGNGGSGNPFVPPGTMAAKGGAKTSLLVMGASPAAKSAYDRGLVTERVTYESVLTEHGRYYRELLPRRFSKTVLGFVTPWNSRGYDVAKNFSSKLTHICPVWYQLKATANGPELGGKQDVDKGWLRALKERRKKVLPRFSVEGWPLGEMVLNADYTRKMVDMVASEISEHGYDGLVLEGWNAWAAAGVLSVVETRSKAFGFVQKLSSRLRKIEQQSRPSMPPGSLQLFFVIPPPSDKKSLRIFNSEDLLYMSSFVDAFPLMTYDFSNLYGPGPNAPLHWVENCMRLLLPGIDEVKVKVQSSKLEDEGGYSHDRELKSVRDSQSLSVSAGIEEKLLIGLNFYGYQFVPPSPGGEAVIAHDYLKIVDTEHPKFVWDNNAHEHFFDYPSPRGTARVYYPTLKSMDLRIEEARQWGAGLSIWELGQGLDFFWDLF